MNIQVIVRQWKQQDERLARVSEDEVWFFEKLNCDKHMPILLNLFV